MTQRASPAAPSYNAAIELLIESASMVGPTGSMPELSVPEVLSVIRAAGPAATSAESGSGSVAASVDPGVAPAAFVTREGLVRVSLIAVAEGAFAFLSSASDPFWALGDLGVADVVDLSEV